MVKTAEFGQPCRAPEPGRCRICGWVGVPRTPRNEFDYADPPPRRWADETRTLCALPACVEEARREIGR